MNTLIGLILSLSMATVPSIKCKSLVTEIYEDDQIKILVKYGDRVKQKQVHGYDFKLPIELAEEIPTKITEGSFTYNGDDNKYYQFKSDDNSVWWALTKSEIGFAPKANEKYVLLYCDNGTTSKNKGCDCPEEWNCECEVYDDILLGVFEEEIKNDSIG